MSIGGLGAGARFTVRRGGAGFTTATADAAGTLTFTDVPPPAVQQAYTLAAAARTAVIAP